MADTLTPEKTARSNEQPVRIQVIPVPPKDLTVQMQYDQGSEAGLIDLVLVFQNIPLGSAWKATSNTPLNGKILQANQENTISTNFKYAWTDLNIPANWTSTFTVEIHFGNNWSGIPPSATPTVELRGELVINGN